MAAVSQVPVSQAVESVRGDDMDLMCTVTDSDTGDVVDVSGWTVTAQIRASADAATPTDLTTDVSSNGDSGIIYVSLADTDSDDLDAGEYVWDVQAVLDDGTVRTIVGGTWTIIADVTRSS